MLRLPSGHVAAADMTWGTQRKVLIQNNKPCGNWGYVIKEEI